ncbi:MAG: nitrous oxide-stimulated promoter family protein [Planctomycetes bacterium]|nr:nitrous oxide-stimulated promoter family protein [Planctomycetota bacterium]
MASKRGKLKREQKTLLAMLRIYCRNHHGSIGKQLCPDCRQLREYADQRLQKCPFGVTKGPCSQCEIHCYKPEMRERIRDVMRYSGPRMLSRHPVLALSHLLKEWRHKSRSSRKVSASSNQ